MAEETAPPVHHGNPLPETDASPKPTGKSAPSAKTKGPRKRTKTGCLTCRRRRIKCGEEKPICNNCIKSSRECEGYGQRVVFRQPVGPISQLPIPPGSNMHGGMASPFPSTQHSHYSAFAGGGTGGRQSFMPLAPRTYPYDGASNHNLTQNISPSMDYHSPFVPGYGQPGDMPRLTVTERGTTTSYGTGDGNVLEQADYPRPRQSNGLQPNERHADMQVDPSVQSYSSHHPRTPYTMQFSSSTQSPGSYNYISSEPRGDNVLPNGAPDRQHLQHVLPDYDDDDDDGADYYDVETDDDEFEVEKSTIIPSRTRSSEIAAQGTQWPIAYISYTNLLANYRPSPFSSPLTDPEAAQIFAHFISSVAPTLDIFDRNPPTQSLLTSDSGPPPEYRNLWTDTLSRLALEHPALLHAMCAASSYHIASTAGQPPTASFRHYHYAVRRIRKAVGLPHRRKQLATVAATLLIGIFEVMDAEHSKWSNHIAGASHLIQETNYAAMIKRIRDMRAVARAEQAHSQEQPPPGLSDESALPNDVFARTESSVDEGIVSVLMGRPVDYDDFRHVSGGIQHDEVKRVLTETDLDEFRTRCNLYWAYCKQDAYRSLISGGRLVMPYERWGQCPPRAAIGDLDAVYGTNDHLVLLLARISEFGAKDTDRKTKVVKANGGVWSPPRMDASPPGAEPAAQDDRPMHGMAPGGTGRLPTGFAQTASSPSPPDPSQSSDDHKDLETLTAEAESEWHDLVAACDEFAKALGPSFDPLPLGTAPEIPTPFGTALQYRTHSVAIIWAFYNTGLTLLHRVHPSMPADPIMAAGVAAPQTARYSQLICRIIAGIYTPPPPNCPRAEVSLAIRGVLTETLICLLYAGLQLTSPEQREWLIATLRDIGHHTGMRSAVSAAGGCEAMWIGMHAAGSGPPYERKFPEAPDAPVVELRHGTVGVPPDERRFLTLARGEEPGFGTGLLAAEERYEYGLQRIIEER